MKITIDHKSGFCFGVTSAISAAENELRNTDKLYCLGDLVHNSAEMQRLRNMGLVVISHEQLKELHDEKILIRAHGEPPETYEIARKNNLNLLDYTCPVVLKLQERIRKGYQPLPEKNGQLVIYGKPGHAEVIGLTGQIGNKAIIIKSPDEMSDIDCSKPVVLFSQTTKDETGFYQLSENIRQGMLKAGIDPEQNLTINNTICRAVVNRVPRLRTFASQHDIIVFVSGSQSSNGQYLFSICYEVNPRSYFISSENELQAKWFQNNNSVGICGATSTPMWLMENVGKSIEALIID
ncbi:MAG: 4-hydroxy-3-methylbut-2-enyl diphosphate reductase [Bacteroidetes bacterium HGW-Bacteroidetes-6]|jgi:4-hydroxy-3-methylbut-2-enyl diphosphate reductase|nr:MAG: 4-hydroxy-3-methylbut-2-enyl diphosphate reductase [Bacteroidetes bacterium HGW-Bacteroidetes-6]